MIRQGDVFIAQVPGIPATAVRVPASRVILAYGEATGHHHEIMEADRVELYECDGMTYIRVNEECHLTHEEHAVQVIPNGDYRVRIQSEYTPEDIKSVRD